MKFVDGIQQEREEEAARSCCSAISDPQQLTISRERYKRVIAACSDHAEQRRTMPPK
jgi:hypothetical protein